MRSVIINGGFVYFARIDGYREKEFAPIKNLHGTDSVDSARELLEKNGIKL